MPGEIVNQHDVTSTNPYSNSFSAKDPHKFDTAGKVWFGVIGISPEGELRESKAQVFLAKLVSSVRNFSDMPLCTRAWFNSIWW